MKNTKVKQKLTQDEINPVTFDLHEYNVHVGTREIFLHGYLDIEAYEQEEPGVEYRMATRFIKNLVLVQQQGDENILIHQHTIGGNWNDGIAIYDAIKACPCLTTILAYAHARSMSSITLQAADRRVLMPNAEVVIHLGWIVLSDRNRAVYSQADYAKKTDATMLRIYAHRCKHGKFFKGKMTPKEITAYIDGQLKAKTDWIMTAEEAVFYGFADGVFGARGFETMEKIRR